MPFISTVFTLKSLHFVTKKHSSHIGRATKVTKFQYYSCRLKNKENNVVSKQNLDTCMTGMSSEKSRTITELQSRREIQKRLDKI